MEMAELKDKTPTELQKLLAENRERLREQRFKAANGQLKDVREIREVRRTIARLLTKLTPVPRRKSV
jgi:ribosomal protein L29